MLLVFCARTLHVNKVTLQHVAYEYDTMGANAPDREIQMGIS